MEAQNREWARMDSKKKKISRKSNSRGFPLGVAVKNLPAKAGDASSVPGSGRSPGKAVSTSILA